MTESHHRHHHWRIWLTLILIVGVVGLLLYTDAGKKTLSTLGTFKLPQFTKTIPASTDTQFSIILNSNVDAFYSQFYKVTSSTFISDGICKESVKINDIVLTKPETKCNVILNSFSGTFNYTKAGIIIVSGKASVMHLDDYTMFSSEPLEVELQIVPFKFTLEGVSQQKISLNSVSGDVTCSKDNNIIGVGYPKNNPVEISNFAGSLKLEEGIATLSGVTTSVKGSGFTCW